MALYFAYGSNMLAARLGARCASSRVIAPALAEGFDIAFDKIGQDGSGKATLVPCKGKAVHGALFHLDDSDLVLLDAIEGLGRGYDRQPVTVRHGGMTEQALAYIAPPSSRDAALLPFCWYRGLVLAGAYERGLPADWIARLASVEASADPVSDRPRRVEAMSLLGDCPAEWWQG